MIHDNLYQHQYKFYTPGPIALIDNKMIKVGGNRRVIPIPNWLSNPTNFFWHFKQNPHLINVHKKLLNTKVEHLNLEKKTLEETDNLATNLERINEKFGKSNHRSFLTRVAQAIINFIKRYVFFQKVTERYHFDQKPIESIPTKF